MGKIRDMIRNSAKKAFKSSSSKTEEVLGKLFPGRKVNSTFDIQSLRKGTPTKYNPPSRSRKTKSRKRK